MKTSIILACTIALLATPALADNKGKNKGKAYKGDRHVTAFCPPGLAKKRNGCMPPGQAKKVHRGHDHDHDDDDHHAHYYRIGDRIPDGYVLVRDPWRYGYREPGTYWRVGDSLFRVNSDTGEVLAVLGLVSALLN